MLHAIRKIICRFADRLNAVAQHLSNVLQGRLVTLTGLVSLRAAHKGLDIVRLIFKDSGGVTDNTIEVGQLLVASSAIAVALQSQIARLQNQKHYDKLHE